MLAGLVRGEAAVTLALAALLSDAVKIESGQVMFLANR